MLNLLIALGVFLLIIILLIIFRIQVLISVLSGSFQRRAGLSNKVNAIMFILFLVFGIIGFFYYSIKWSENFLPESASVHGVWTDNLFWITTGIITVPFIITHILLFLFPYQYQFSEDRRALFYPDNTKLELLWTVIPAIVMAVLVFSGWKVWTEITQPAPEEAIRLEIKGKQFAWQVRYGGQDNQIGPYDFRMIDATNTFGMDFSDKRNFDDFVPREIHVMKGKPVEFKIRAVDVLHSVFLPHFRQKMDAVPGMPTSFHFVPKYTTAEMREITGNPKFNYELACTEVCGRGHFAMRMVVVVDDEEDYKKWYAEQKSWLSSNPDYIAKVPSNLKELASNAAGIQNNENY